MTQKQQQQRTKKVGGYVYFFLKNNVTGWRFRGHLAKMVVVQFFLDFIVLWVLLCMTGRPLQLACVILKDFSSGE